MNPSASEAKHRNLWAWGCALLALVAIGLLVWALSVRGDLDTANEQVAQLKAEAAAEPEPEATPEPVEPDSDALVAAFKTAYESLTAQLGTNSEDLATLTAEVEAAREAADQAKEDLAAARDDVSAQAAAAQANSEVIADCAKASLGALGQLFEGDSILDQVAAVRESMQTITADCKDAFAGT